MNINKVFIINLKHRTDRKAHMIKELERIGIRDYEFFEAIKPGSIADLNRWNPNFLKIRPDWLKGETDEYYLKYRLGALGCLMSHAAIMQLAIQRGYNQILILEDDVIFNTNKIKNFNHLLMVLKGEYEYLRSKNKKQFQKINSFDLLYLGGATQLSLLKNITPSLALTMNTGCTHAYIVPETAMKYILSIIRHSVVEIDKFYIQQIQQRGKSFYVTPPFANPGNSFSDIVQKEVCYKKAMTILNS